MLYIISRWLTLSLFLSIYLAGYLIAQNSIRNDLLAVKDFEDGNLLSGMEVAGRAALCCAHSAELVTSPVRAGKYAVRFHLNRTDPEPSNGGPRSEMGFRKESRPGDERWYGMSIYLPGDWISDTTKVVLAQWYPHLTLNTIKKRWFLVITDNSGRTRDYSLGPIQEGRWTDFVAHIKWSFNSDGRVQFWRDGTQFVDDKGPNTGLEKRLILFKFGIYKPAWKKQSLRDSQVDQITVFHDEIRIGGPNSGYQEVNPGGSEPHGEANISHNHGQHRHGR